MTRQVADNTPILSVNLFNSTRRRLLLLHTLSSDQLKRCNALPAPLQKEFRSTKNYVGYLLA